MHKYSRSYFIESFSLFKGLIFTTLRAGFAAKVISFNCLYLGFDLDRDLDAKDVFNLSAKVINNSIFKRNNYLTINKGKKHGVEDGMGVISTNGVIGIVHSTSENYALIISILKSPIGDQ